MNLFACFIRKHNRLNCVPFTAYTIKIGFQFVSIHLVRSNPFRLSQILFPIIVIMIMIMWKKHNRLYVPGIYERILSRARFYCYYNSMEWNHIQYNALVLVFHCGKEKHEHPRTSELLSENDWMKLISHIEFVFGGSRKKNANRNKSLIWNYKHYTLSS